MKILVTGGCGYIGHYLIDELSKYHEITVIDDLSNSFLRFNSKIDFKIFNLLDKHKLNLLFEQKKFDLIVHLAAFKSVPESLNIPLDYYSNNIISTLNLLEMCKIYKCNNFIFTSSASVYKSSEQNLVETAELCSTNPYGQSKIICEQILKDYCNENKNFNCTVLRLFNVIGGKEYYKKKSTNLIPTILKSINENKRINITTTSYRDYVSVFDIVNIINLLINNLDKHFEVYNIGTGLGYTAKDIVEKFQETYDVKIKYKLVKTREGDANRIISNNTKIKNKLNYIFETNLDKLLR